MMRRFIRAQIMRYGVEGLMMMILNTVAKITTSKKDDILVQKIKAVLAATKQKKRKSESSPD